MNRRELLTRFAPALAAIGLTVPATAGDPIPSEWIKPEEMDEGDLPTTPDGDVILPVTSPISPEYFPGRNVVYVMNDEWEALVLARAIRKMNRS
jgi:hypothetical protein